MINACMYHIKVVYFVLNEKYPIPEEYEALARQEKEFGVKYLESTGITWRHYFGKEGPRPPPSLPMWPAHEIGETHHLVSKHGFW